MRDDVIQAVTAYLNEAGHPYTFKEPTVVEITLHFPLKAIGQLVQMKELVLIGDRDIQAVGVMPFSVPESSRALAAEYLTRVNWYQQAAWFAMDYSDGEVRARAQRWQMSGVPAKEELASLVMTPVSLITQYASGLILTIKGMGTPRDNAERFTPDALK